MPNLRVAFEMFIIRAMQIKECYRGEHNDGIHLS